MQSPSGNQGVVTKQRTEKYVDDDVDCPDRHVSHRHFSWSLKRSISILRLGSRYSVAPDLVRKTLRDLALKAGESQKEADKLREQLEEKMRQNEDRARSKSRERSTSRMDRDIHSRDLSSGGLCK
jgi:hypothetical protein